MSLQIDVIGVTLLIPSQKRIAYPDGRSPRNAVTDGSIIPPHQGFIGLAAGTYETDAIPRFSFSFDFAGAGDPTIYDVWLLDGHTISVPGAQPAASTSIANQRVFKIRELVPSLVLCPHVATFSCNNAVGWLDFSNATSMAGSADANLGPLTIRVGDSVREVTTKFSITYDSSDADTIVVAGPVDSMTFRLRDKAPWQVITGNSPIEDLLGAQAMHPAPGAPLTHVELVYQLYHVERETIQVPVLVDHGHEHQHPMSVGSACGPDADDGPVGA